MESRIFYRCDACNKKDLSEISKEIGIRLEKDDEEGNGYWEF